MRDDAVVNLFRISAFLALVQSRPAFRFVVLMVPAAPTRCIDVVMVFDLYVAGEFYFGTNAARLENGFRTPEHFESVHVFSCRGDGRVAAATFRLKPRPAASTAARTVFSS
jgi:hypothetical protein